MGYESGKIYKITCGDYYYYGSCITSLSRRATTHRYRANKISNRLYDYIKDKEWSISLVKDYPCSSQEELRTEEDKFVKNELTNELCLNERSAVWDIEKCKAKQREWYIANRERLLIKAREAYAIKKRSKT